MLFNLLFAVPLVVWGGTEFGFPDFEIYDRFTIPINQCMENVTRTSAGGTFSDSGSTYCMCTEGDTLTESGFSCFYYDESGCTGNVVEEHWGGCDTNSQIITTVENCNTAQESLEEGEDCPYFIRDTSTSIMARKIYPLETCIDYYCNSDNSDDERRSCFLECDTTGGSTPLTQSAYDDYECSGNLASSSCTYCNQVSNKVCGSTNSAKCSVTVTQWEVDDSTFECGSKSGRNNFKTSKKSSVKSNYIMLGNDQTPYPIEQCAQMKYGYYSYSYQYKCNDEGTEVYLYHYLNDDGKCDDDEDNGDRYLIETYVSSNTTFKCDGSDSTGKIGYYEECDDYNWDAKYYEYLTLFGECVPLKSNPLATSDAPSDGSTWANQPWYQNLRVVMSCNLDKRGKIYPSVYLYVTEDCSGDYLFTWDWDDYYDQLSSYGVQDCSIPQIKGCSNGQDGVRRGNLPTKEFVC